jgi:hypothetical protein
MDRLWAWQGSMIQGYNDRQGFVALKAEHQKALACIVDQGNTVQKGAGHCKISSDTFYSDRDHGYPPLCFFSL